MSQQKERLLNNQATEVIADMANWQALTTSAQEVQRRALGYLREHTGRMREQTLREQGYHIGSGVIEAGCKNVVQGRFKGVGMRWSSLGAQAMSWGSLGAQAMLQVRASWCSREQLDFAAAARRATLSS